MVEVPQHDPFDRNCGRRHRASAEQARHESKNQAAEATEQVTSAARAATRLQFRPEDRAMVFFVRFEVQEFGHHRWCGQSSHEGLRRIDVDCAVFSGVIDLEDA